MPRSTVKKKTMFREFSKLDQKYVRRNYLKRYRSIRKDFQERHGLVGSQLDFLLWAYDLEFWTIRFAAKDFGMVEKKAKDRLLYPLKHAGYIYNHFNKLTPSQNAEDHLFRDETKYNYRVRYAITQKARMLVQTFYRLLED